jgi:hypothetical protein
LAIYTPRNSEEIQRLLGAARSAQESAENDIAESRRLVDVADGRVRIMNDEVKTTKTRLSVAKKAKDASDRTTLNIELKRQKAELKYIERVRDSKKSDAAWLDGKSNAWSARVKALELEVDVARKFENIVVAGTDSAPGIAGYRDALKQMLTARGEAADRAGGRQRRVLHLDEPGHFTEVSYDSGRIYIHCADDINRIVARQGILKPSYRLGLY